jgi:hypothetical protein
MSKKTKYPKKFRQKLEKIAAERDARNLRDPSEMTPDELMDAASDMLWRDFLPAGSVAVMHGRVHENQRRMELTMHLDFPRFVARVAAPAPWLDEETGTSLSE